MEAGYKRAVEVLPPPLHGALTAGESPYKALDEVEDGRAGLGRRGDPLAIEELTLERREEALTRACS